MEDSGVLDDFLVHVMCYRPKLVRRLAGRFYCSFYVRGHGHFYIMMCDEKFTCRRPDQTYTVYPWEYGIPRVDQVLRHLSL
jgi:hypothetical protein